MKTKLKEKIQWVLTIGGFVFGIMGTLRWQGPAGPMGPAGKDGIQYGPTYPTEWYTPIHFDSTDAAFIYYNNDEIPLKAPVVRERRLSDSVLEAEYSIKQTFNVRLLDGTEYLYFKFSFEVSFSRFYDCQTQKTFGSFIFFASSTYWPEDHKYGLKSADILKSSGTITVYYAGAFSYTPPSLEYRYCETISAECNNFDINAYLGMA